MSDDPVALTERLGTMCCERGIRHARIRMPDGLEIEVDLAAVRNPLVEQKTREAPPPSPVSADMMDAFGAATPVLRPRKQ